MGKLLIIDGLNIVRRVYEANSDALDSDEKAARALVNALYSFRKMLGTHKPCLLYTSPSPRDKRQSRMPSSA